MAKLDIAQLTVTYRRTISQNLLCIINDKLVYLEPVNVSSNHLCRIVVPLSLRRVTFDAMHTSPAAGHMGEYKTLYCIKLRFFWHRIRKDIKAWVILPLYINLCMKATRSGGNIILACQFTVCYSPYRFLDARSF